jgi:hypothetical protein
MPVIRYKSFEQAQEALWHYQTGGEYYRQIANLFDFYDKLNSRAYPSGIFKYKNIEAFDRQKAAWMIDLAPNRKTVPNK